MKRNTKAKLGLSLNFDLNINLTLEILRKGSFWEL